MTVVIDTSKDSKDDRFKYHKPTAEAAELHDDFRAQIEDLTTWVESRIPNSREATEALTKLEEAMFWGNAAIAREISAKAPTQSQ